jgi:hypothetical protein
MTQAFNLGLLANNVSTSGKLDASVGLANAVPVANGGTGLTATPANGQVPIGNGSNFTLATITAGNNVSITNGSGTITIAATGGATGGGTDKVFVQNGQTVTTTYSFPSATNASSVGPITINSGVSVTLPSGCRWLVL